MRAPAVLLGLLVLASGCAGTDPAKPADGGSAGPDGTDGAGGNGTLPAADAPRAQPSLERSPDLRLGDWFRFRLTEDFTGASVEFTRVVAGVEGEYYLIGMPREEFINEVMVLHIPGLGQVARADLSFEIHDAVFAPLKFPLRDGATWQTEFEGRPVTATARLLDGMKAEVRLVGPTQGLAPVPLPTDQPTDNITLTYDATVGEIVKYAGQGYATYELVEHGAGFQGIVTVPHMHDLVFQQVRIGANLGGDLTPSPDPDVVEVDTTYDRVSFIIGLGAVLPDTKSPNAGVYKEKVTTPDGTVYEKQVLPTDGPGLKIWYYLFDKPGGKWTFEHTAVGPGIALVEGIAYHVYDVELPGGRVLPSTGEHQHGG